MGKSGGDSEHIASGNQRRHMPFRPTCWPSSADAEACCCASCSISCCSSSVTSTTGAGGSPAGAPGPSAAPNRDLRSASEMANGRWGGCTFQYETDNAASIITPTHAEGLPHHIALLQLQSGRRRHWLTSVLRTAARCLCRCAALQLHSGRDAGGPSWLCPAGAAALVLPLLRPWPAAGCAASRIAAAVIPACMVTAHWRAACVRHGCLTRGRRLGQGCAAGQGGRGRWHRAGGWWA